MSWSLTVPATHWTKWEKAVLAAEHIGQNSSDALMDIDSCKQYLIELGLETVKCPYISGSISGHTLQDDEDYPGSKVYDGFQISVAGHIGV